jgi:hypothetical protein
MEHPSPSPLSLNTLRGLRCRDSARWKALYEQIEELDLGLQKRLATWAAEVNAPFLPTPYIQRFIAFLRALPSREVSDVEEAFLRHELRAFIERTDTDAQERDALLTELDIPCDARERIYELCFIPGIVFEWCTTIIPRSTQAYKASLKKQQRLRSLCSQIQHEVLLSARIKAGMQREMDIMLEFLQLQYPPPDEVRKWQTHLGIDKRLKLKPQKQRIWSPLFKELVDLLRPYCRGTKKHYIAKTLATEHIPEQVFRCASRLMHLSLPKLWPDRPDLVKRRYHSS